ncbi:Cofilin [Fusarium austroafricanum]|uniref:Cofilin n=1 Tax=Fusarium austroafricanum TaxID=2364996 RepID=A0A8H4KSW6_9HYPO|nr:Cofilin [Fusarium austroafricanum]
MPSGVNVSPACMEAYQKFRLQHKDTYIIYKLDDGYNEIVVDRVSDNNHMPSEKAWEEFCEKLENATAKIRGNVGKGPRCAVYNFRYHREGVDGTLEKIIFISWSPDEANIQAKMIYASNRDSLRRSLNGIGLELQATDLVELEYDYVVSKLNRGR